MSKAEREAEKRVVPLKLGGGSKGHHPARGRYWQYHEKPGKVKNGGTGMERRLRKDDGSLLQLVYELGNKSDLVVLREKPEDLIRNLAFVQHQQRLQGALVRLAKTSPWGPMPRRVVALLQRSAFVTTEGR